MSTDGHLTIGQCGSKDGLKVDRVTDDQARYRIEGMDGCLLDQLPARMNVVIKQGVMEIRLSDDPAKVPYRFGRR